ncbi:MAG TPA: carboxypeptidase-like regulatory domain-containing protein, partial [Thermoanaerobaculia bacterium]|nr:carboxypeptidase-like regulatory domain-containing protein [Thermoanaerobaculia bacterium]
VKEDGTFVLPDAPAGKGTLVVDGGDAGYVEVSSVSVPAPADKKLIAVLAPPSALEGRAVDAKSGKAIPRVKVEIKSGTSVRLARTGPDGHYRIRPLPPGHFRLRADEPRYVPYLKEDVHVLAGDSRKVDLPLHLGATMTGRVVDENGAPIVGAKGSLARGGETGIRAFMRRMRRSETASFRTGKDGTFRATRLMPGENQKLSVEHADYETASLGGVALAPGGTTAGISIAMKRGATIAGLVHDADGNPIPRVEVELSSEMAAGGRGGAMLSLAGMAGRSKVESGADGRFAAKGLAPGDYNLTFTKSGWAKETAEAVKVVEGKPADFLEVTLAPGVSISGKVTTKGGSGVEGYMVVAGSPARGVMGRGSPRPDAPTGPDGFFVIDGLKAGATYDLQLLSSTGLGPQKKGVVAPADGLEIVVKGNGRIRGVVLDSGSGQPLTDFQVKYEAPPRRGGMAFRFASRAGRFGFGADKNDVHADDGSFVLEDVPAGTWDVVVEAKGYQTARAGGIVVEEGATKDGVEVKIAKGSLLKGRVTDAGNARPVPDASVTVGSTGSGGGGMGPMIAGLSGDESILTDADGRFEVEGLAPGKLHVSVKHPDYTEASENVELKEGGSSVELKLATGGILAGTVFG